MRIEIIFEESVIGYLDQVQEVVKEDGIFHYMPYRSVQHLHFVEKMNSDKNVDLFLKNDKDSIKVRASKTDKQNFIMIQIAY